MEFLDRIPYSLLVGIAVFMALAPFYPMPHLIEKIIMLKEGTLKKPIDIFDLFYHAAPIVLLVLKIWRDSQKA